MLVISDNSALSALAEMEMAWVLPKIVGQITVPAAVAREALHPRAPVALRTLIENPPAWLEIVADPPEILPGNRGARTGRGGGDLSGLVESGELLADLG